MKIRHRVIWSNLALVIFWSCRTLPDTIRLQTGLWGIHYTFTSNIILLLLATTTSTNWVPSNRHTSVHQNWSMWSTRVVECLRNEVVCTLSFSIIAGRAQLLRNSEIVQNERSMFKILRYHPPTPKNKFKKITYTHFIFSFNNKTWKMDMLYIKVFIVE